MNFPLEKGDSSSNSMPKNELEEKDETISAQHVKRAQLKMQFYGTRKEEDQTIEAYVKQLKSLSDSLAAIGSPISESDLVLQLLAGLPSQYLFVQNTVSSQWPLPSFSEACSMLYMYETLLLQEQKTPYDLLGAKKSALGIEENNSSKSSYKIDIKETVDKIHDIASSMSTMASIAGGFIKMLGWSDSGTSASGAAASPTATGNNKKYSKGPAGRGRNYNKRSGPSTNCRNSGPK